MKFDIYDLSSLLHLIFAGFVFLATGNIYYFLLFYAIGSIWYLAGAVVDSLKEGR